MPSNRKSTPGTRYATARLCANHFPTLDLHISTEIKIWLAHIFYQSSFFFYPVDPTDILEIQLKSMQNIEQYAAFVTAAETWTLKKRDMNRLRAFEMKCLRRLLNVKWQQKIKNTDIMKRTGTSINIVHRIMERQLNIFGHICRMQDDASCFWHNGWQKQKR